MTGQIYIYSNTEPQLQEIVTMPWAKGYRGKTGRQGKMTFTDNELEESKGKT